MRGREKRLLRHNPTNASFYHKPRLRMSSAAHFWVERHAWAGLCHNPAYPRDSPQATRGMATFRMLVMVPARGPKG